MKRICILLAGICMSITAMAQEDSTKKETQQSDTIRIGSMIIIKRGGSGEGSEVQITKRRYYKPSRITTNWVILDIGFSNYNDNTDYAQALADGFVGPGVGYDQFKLRTGKSTNVNIWLFMQRLNMINHVVNLKYGLGIELNNYRYKEPIKYLTSPTQIILDTTTTYSKNKLAADYVTIPLMINFNFTPDRREGFGFSVGMSAGYRYASRQKTITGAYGKQKEKDDFDLDQWKFSYVAEIQLGPVKLYGSMATTSMFTKGLDQTPYNFGLRLSNW